MDESPPAAARPSAPCRRTASPSSRTAWKKRSAAPSSSRASTGMRWGVARPALSSTRPIDSPASLPRVDWPGGQRRVLAGSPRHRHEQFDCEPGTLAVKGSSALIDPWCDAEDLDPLVLVAGADHLLDKHAEAIRGLVHRHAAAGRSPASIARAWPSLRSGARAASCTRSCPTSSSSTNRSWTTPSRSAPSRPASRFSLAGIGPAKPPFTRRPSSPIRFRPGIS